MKIAVASDDGINLTGHVGRCDMFLVYDVNDKLITGVQKRENNFTMHKQGNHDNHEHHGNSHGNHGHHNHHGILEGLKDCGYLICSCAGPGLVSDLRQNGIETILTDEMEADKAVNMLLNGTLINSPGNSCHEHHN
jgi:predicted Fe-Mo cluster-binding NifX family protein